MFPDIIGEPFANKHTKLSIDGKVVKRLLAEGEEALPYEYSALLAGTDSVITHYYPAPTAERHLHTFSWDGQFLLASLQSMKQEQLVWLGVLHSHPSTPAHPSRADWEGWHYPTLSYWILSFSGSTPDLRLYQQKSNVFLRRTYTVE